MKKLKSLRPQKSGESYESYVKRASEEAINRNVPSQNLREVGKILAEQAPDPASAVVTVIEFEGAAQKNTEIK